MPRLTGLMSVGLNVAWKIQRSRFWRNYRKRCPPILPSSSCALGVGSRHRARCLAVGAQDGSDRLGHAAASSELAPSILFS